MDFIISQFSSGWSPVCFEAAGKKLEMDVSYCRDSFTEIADGLLFLWNNESGVQHIYFDLEADGWVHLLMINYPEGLLKLEFYKDVLWFDIGEDDENPLPVLSFVTTLHQFAYLFCREMNKHGEDGYGGWGHSFPALQLKQLKNKMLPPSRFPK